jgi:glutathione reductase (NADPH)
MTSDDVFHLKEQPKRIVILGGGYIGTEFACIMHGLGSEVMQVIRGNKILRGFDEDLRTEIQDGMIKHGIQILNQTELIAIEKTEDGLQLKIRQAGAETESIFTDIVSLAAVGRRPNTQHLGLENTGIEMNGSAIVVDERNRTAEENIYAVGDCTDRINLTPVAIQEGRALADTLFGGNPRYMNYDNIPTAIFSTPEAATVGLTEGQAKEKYGEEAIKIYRSRFRPMFYTLPNHDEKTMMKLVVHQESNKVLGAHMVGDYSAEIIQGVAIALKMGATKADFDATVGIHPTSAEEFVTMR